MTSFRPSAWLRRFTAACLLQAGAAGADPAAWDTEFGGHLKGQASWAAFPDDSVFRAVIGKVAQDLGGEGRLKVSTRKGPWDLKLDYQFIAIHSDRLQAARRWPALPGSESGVISDDRRWFDLTQVIEDSGPRAAVQRLDRLSVGLTTANTAWRFGRQAISWGNGLVFTPMDIFNPFDPAAVDKEYKTGDDMLYGQYLVANGDDLQGVAVVRRDALTGDVRSEASSLAFKYHGFLGTNEFDVLAAEHYGDSVLGLGGILAVGGAIWRGDLTRTRTRDATAWSGTLSVSYSWTWSGKNLSGLLEYYRNGFGQPDGRYTPGELAMNPELLLRIERGELFTLGRNYLAASATIELDPRFWLVANAFVNLDDPSSLLQWVGRFDWRQDLQWLLALNVPVGASGTEYGGIESGIENRYFSSGPGVFAQLAWYF